MQTAIKLKIICNTFKELYFKKNNIIKKLKYYIILKLNLK